MKPNEKTKRKKGVVAIEAALVLPILILITLAGLQYGWLFLKQQEITNVARHVVRYATRPDVSFAEAQAKAVTMMTTMGLDGYIIDNEVDWVDGAPDDDPPGPVGNALYVKISVKAADDGSGPGVDIINFLPSPAKLTAYATMCKEGPGS